MNAATLGMSHNEFQKTSGALHAAGILGLIRYKQPVIPMAHTLDMGKWIINIQGVNMAVN